MNLVASPLRPLIRHWRHWYARDACNEPVRPPFMILLSVPLTAGCCCCLFFGFRSVHISPGYSFNLQFNSIQFHWDTTNRFFFLFRTPVSWSASADYFPISSPLWYSAGAAGRSLLSGSTDHDPRVDILWTRTCRGQTMPLRIPLPVDKYVVVE